MEASPGVELGSGVHQAWRPRWRGQCLVGREGWHYWAADAAADQGHPEGDCPEGGAAQLEAGHGGL
jgi:hypothetical protein